MAQRPWIYSWYILMDQKELWDRIRESKNKSQQWDNITKGCPEHFACAANEVWLFNLLLTYVMTFVFNKPYYDSNPLKSRLGINAVWIGLGEEPCVLVAAPLHVLMIHFRVKYWYFNKCRSGFLEKRSVVQEWLSHFNSMVAVPVMSVTILMYIIRPSRLYPVEEEFIHPDYVPFVHSILFFASVAVDYISYMEVFCVLPPDFHPTGSQIFRIMYSVSLLGYATLSLAQIGLYDANAKKMGPIPPWLTKTFGVFWLVCVVLKSRMRPLGPEISLSLVAISDDDFIVDRDKRINHSRSYTSLENAGDVSVTREPWWHALKTLKVSTRKGAEVQHVDGSTCIVDTFKPEDWATSGGELLVLAMVSSWIMSFLFSKHAIEKNPLQDRVGYNNLCVGWDQPPASFIAAPIFMGIVIVNIRFTQLKWLRKAVLDHSSAQWRVTEISTVLTTWSWSVAFWIFVVRPIDTPESNLAPFLHTVSFVQLVAFKYMSYVFNFVVVSKKYYTTAGLVFCCLYGVVCASFGAFAVVMMLTFDEETDVRGPIPWWVVALSDYSWFACTAVAGTFRPVAPSLELRWKLVDNKAAAAAAAAAAEAGNSAENDGLMVPADGPGAASASP